MAGKKNCGRCRKPKSLCNCGRPSVMTPEVIAKLEYAFSLGSADKLACIFAGVSEDAMYEYCIKHPEFRERKEALKTNIKLKALHNIAGAIKNEDLETSKWYAERKMKEDFSTRQESTGADGNPLFPVSQAELETISKIPMDELKNQITKLDKWFKKKSE